MDIFSVVAKAQAENASDIHLTISTPPLLRVDGMIKRMEEECPLTENDLRENLRKLVRTSEYEQFEREHELDFSYGLADGTRLRGNAIHQRGTLSIAFRILPPVIPTIDSLELPQIYKKLITMDRGLIIVSGPTGSGKTTSQAAMVNYLNNTRTRHIVTIEDPIEYSHQNVNCIIVQREVGKDTDSFAEAVTRITRHDPDVVILGEMRDAKTAEAVIQLAETGHLIITTSHAPYAPRSIERTIDLFPPEERYRAQMRIASLLTAVLCQTLVPRIDQPGRLAAVEIMLINSAISNLIHEGRFNQMTHAISSYRQIGMVTLDESLIELYDKGKISGETLMEYCRDAHEVSRVLSGRNGAKFMNEVDRELVELNR